MSDIETDTKNEVDVFIAVGSNIEPQKNITQAVILLKHQVQIIGISNFYCTKASGKKDQPMFLNGILKIQTTLEPRNLKYDCLRNIEHQLGRKRTADKHASRTIDLDLILYGNLVIDEPGLQLPDLNIIVYPFIAVPLFEIAPELILPDTKKPLKEESAAHNHQNMFMQKEFTQKLKDAIFSKVKIASY